MHFEFIFCSWHLYHESTKFKKTENTSISGFTHFVFSWFSFDILFLKSAMVGCLNCALILG